MTDDLTRRAVSDAVTELGWRLELNRLVTAVAVDSLSDGARLTERIVATTGAPLALRVDLRARAVLITIEPPSGRPTDAELEVARAVSAAVSSWGGVTAAAQPGHVVQTVEFAIDTMDIDAIRPFWRAVMGYVDAPDGSLVDPAGQGFSVWFQQLDEPRTQRNRIHFDVVVPHDAAAARIEATLAAGGRVLSAAEAPAFWILADTDGNEVCICTWQGRDPSD